MSFIEQLPRLSAYDPGAAGEGGLDPLGLSAVADRIANVLAPGVRARMSLPRFVTISAVGAFAYQALHELSADDGATSVDIAFEWIVVEAIVRNPGQGRTENLPGNQKATRARAANERLSKRTYLNGPRVFGFTGVYRPFSRDIGVLTAENFPGENATRLVGAWERDLNLPGYIDGVSGTRGGQLRKDITEACKRTLEKRECDPPPNGKLLCDLSDYLAPREARANERKVLRELITTGEHEIRNEITAKLVATTPPEGIPQRELALTLLVGVTLQTRQAIQAAIDYEEAATALHNSFRRFLAYTTQQHGSLLNPSRILEIQELVELAPRISELVNRAIRSVAALDDTDLSNETAHGLRRFSEKLDPVEFFNALIDRHEEVQANRKKLSWLDQLNGEWIVRPPYRNQSGDLDGESWVHPMRLVTLAKFLRESA